MKKVLFLIALSMASLTISLFAQTGGGELALGCKYTGNYYDHCLTASVAGGVWDVYACTRSSESTCGY